MAEVDEFIQLSTELQQLLTPEVAWGYAIIPRAQENNKLHFFIDENKAANGVKEELEVLLGKEVHLEKANATLISRTLSKYYRKNQGASRKSKAERYTGKADDFLQNLIAEARNINSSDIHIESYEEKARVRYRIDGLLIERYIIARTDYPALINKIKIRAALDIAEKRLPQDGRILFDADGLKFDIRVSLLPTLYGEKVVLRLLGSDAANIDIKLLGFSEKQMDDYLEGTKKPEGIMLISGPTGSGKTTTLYATLKILNETTANVVTIEDPIEYTLDGINQVQLKDDIGLNFTRALRSFLRQDPDVIMLGEIRDGETAQMAIRAALTGHLVLSTIHTNSAWGTVSRLVDMGVPPYLLANTLNTSVAQRLVRLLCPECKEEQAFEAKLLPKAYKAPRTMMTHWMGKGCDHCHYTGYKGRKAVYEVIPIDFEIAECIKNNQFDISSLLKERGIKSITETAFELFESGQTSLEEVYSLLMSQ